jgi:hypothetical protein
MLPFAATSSEERVWTKLLKLEQNQEFPPFSNHFSQIKVAKGPSKIQI